MIMSMIDIVSVFAIDVFIGMDYYNAFCKNLRIIMSGKGIPK